MGVLRVADYVADLAKKWQPSAVLPAVNFSTEFLCGILDRATRYRPNQEPILNQLLKSMVNFE